MIRSDILRAIVIVTLVAITACSPRINLSNDYDRAVDFSVFKTYAINKQTTVGNVNQLNEERIVKAIRSEMTKRGYIENGKNPDLKINTVVVLKKKQEFLVNGNSYAVAGPLRPYNWSSRTGQATVRSREYKEGTLVIDVVEARTENLIWTVTTFGELSKQPKNPDEAIRNIIEKIMTDLPVANYQVKGN